MARAIAGLVKKAKTRVIRALTAELLRVEERRSVQAD